MTSREKVLAIFNRKGTGEGAMWTGHPNEATVPIYACLLYTSRCV